MSRQFSVIITENPKKVRIQIKNNHDKIKQKSKTYFKTPSQAILLSTPDAGRLRGRQADVVVNETTHTNLSKIAAKPEGIIINTKTENYTVEEEKQ